MLVIRMQRTGRKGHAMFRVVVQDSRRTPTSGKIVAPLGSYDPHSKAVNLHKEKAQFYLDHGAQPSERVAVLLKAEGVKLPEWVSLNGNKTRSVRNADKRRSTRPAEPEQPTEAAPVEPAAAEETPAAESATEKTPAEAVSEAPAAEPSESAPEAEATAESAAEPETSAAGTETPEEKSEEA
ncbi:MAG TPA: 30S ribosomal protein S16 [Candidatus Saccharimonadales bacterium]